MPPQNDRWGEDFASAPKTAERPSDRCRGCGENSTVALDERGAHKRATGLPAVVCTEVVPVEIIVAMERRVQGLEQRRVDDLFAGRVADQGGGLEDAARRVTEIEAKVPAQGAAIVRRPMERVHALSESIPDIAMSRVGDASGALLSDVAQCGGG